MLASGSPRRSALLRAAGVSFRVIVPAASERPEALGFPPAADGAPPPDPPRLASALALEKALQVAARLERPQWVLGADTMVLVPGTGQVAGKPRDPEHARALLTALGRAPHTVLTGLALVHSHRGVIERGAVASRVTLRRLSEPELEAYLASDAWRGKAGGYGAQDEPGIVERIEGSESNVIGLPLAWVVQRLQHHGIAP